MNIFFKLKAILPIILGIIIGGLLFALGEYDDAPGMCAIGLSVGFILIMIGINNTGIIKKGLLAPILLLFFAAFIALLTTAILLDGEFGDNPWYSAFGFVVAIVLLIIVAGQGTVLCLDRDRLGWQNTSVVNHYAKTCKTA